ncbi:MAG: hypothetical protein RMY30_038775 [Nostoc sp. CmiSLP01]|nr:hypothetical protein [Nostoc sp. CmiSLP01]
MNSDDYFTQWQRMRDHLADAPHVQPSFLKPVKAMNTENRMPSHSPDECPCAEKIAEQKEQLALFQEM